MSVTDQELAKPSTTNGQGEVGNSVKIVYILFLVAPLTMGMIGIVGLIWAYVARGGSDEKTSSHLTLSIRTFWIGLLYTILAVIPSFVTLGMLAPVMALVLLVWYYVRLVKGLIAFNNSAAHPNPKTWLV